MNAVVQQQERPALSHFTAEPLTEIRSIQQPGTQEGWGWQPKPYGLWVSVDGEDDWPSWCDGAGFGLDRLALRYRIVLSEPERLLWLTSAIDLLAFTDRYNKPYTGDNAHLFPKGYYIDWPRVAQEYPGIVIAPYQWSCRLRDGTHWYYGWDCASGCIWDSSMIAEVHLFSGNSGESE